MQKKELLGMYINTGTYAEFADTVIAKALAAESNYACLANVHMLVETRKSLSFTQTVNGAGMVMPDGKPIAWALRLLYGIKQERVAGMEMLPSLLALAEQRNVPVFFYGGSEAMLQKASAVLKEKFASLNIAGMYSPPFRQLTPKEERNIVDTINGSGAKLVIVILGCPKQERWMEAMRGKVQAFMVGLGGAMPVLLGMQKRAPRWMQTGGLEWVYRLVQEPKRLFKRYAVTNTIFLYLLCKALFRKKVLGRTASEKTPKQEAKLLTSDL